LLPCPPSTQWTSDGLEKDLYIQSNSVTVLAMDGRRRWLDIKKLVGDWTSSFQPQSVCDRSFVYHLETFIEVRLDCYHI